MGHLVNFVLVVTISMLGKVVTVMVHIKRAALQNYFSALEEIQTTTDTTEVLQELTYGVVVAVLPMWHLKTVIQVIHLQHTPLLIKIIY